MCNSSAGNFSRGSPFSRAKNGLGYNLFLFLMTTLILKHCLLKEKKQLFHTLWSKTDYLIFFALLKCSGFICVTRGLEATTLLWPDIRYFFKWQLFWLKSWGIPNHKALSYERGTSVSLAYTATNTCITGLWQQRFSPPQLIPQSQQHV